MPTFGHHTVASKLTLQTRNGQSALIVARFSVNDKLECDRTTPRKAGIYLKQETVRMLLISGVHSGYTS